VGHIWKLILICAQNIIWSQGQSLTEISIPLTHIQAFLLVERDSFHGLLHYCRPGLLDKDIPKRKTFRAEIVRHAQLAEEKVRDQLKVWLNSQTIHSTIYSHLLSRIFVSKISFMFDAWTSTVWAWGSIYISLLPLITSTPLLNVPWTGSWRQISSLSSPSKVDTLAKIWWTFWLTLLIDMRFEEKYVIQTTQIIFLTLRLCSRLDGLLVMVLPSMVLLFPSLKSSLMKETMAGQPKNMSSSSCMYSSLLYLDIATILSDLHLCQMHGTLIAHCV